MYKTFLIMIAFMMLLISMIMFSSNPINLGLIVVIQAMLLAVLSSLFLGMSWFSFILCIVFLGGILMLFSYIISMTKVKEFTSGKINTKWLFMPLIFFMFFLNENKMIYLEITNVKKLKFQEFFFNLFSENPTMIILLLILLLFLMMVSVYLIESSKGSLRTM